MSEQLKKNFDLTENIPNKTFKNNNIPNILSPISPMNFSNICYYQNLPYSYNSPQISRISLYNINDSFNNQSNNEQYLDIEEDSTPKMHFDFMDNQNNEENNQNNLELNKKPIEPNLTLSNAKTNNSSLNNNLEIEPFPIIQNIVSTADFGCKFNLKEISLISKNSQYHPKRFSGLIMRIKEPKTTALIFSTGKIVVLGAKTEETSKNACRKFGKILKNMGYKVILKNFRIENIVSSCDLKFKIPLLQLYIQMKRFMDSEGVFYEPETFPGLIYHYIDEDSIFNQTNNNKLNLVFLIFDSGKIVIAGAKKRNQIYNSFGKIFPLLKQFKENKVQEK